MDTNEEDNNVIEGVDGDAEDKGTIFSEEFDPKKREGVVNLKNDKVFTYIQVDNIYWQSFYLSSEIKSNISARVNDQR